MAGHKPKFSLLKNFLTAVKSSVGSKIFRKLYFRIGAKEIDVLRNGDLSCAFFVSSLLKLFNLIPEIHTTVKETVKDMRRGGWRAVKKPGPGCVIVYKARKFKSGETHKHVGFHIGGGKAISNQSNKRSPGIHKWDYRPVEEILWNKKLQKK